MPDAVAVCIAPEQREEAVAMDVRHALAQEVSFSVDGRLSKRLVARKQRCNASIVARHAVRKYLHAECCAADAEMLYDASKK